MPRVLHSIGEYIKFDRKAILKHHRIIANLPYTFHVEKVDTQNMQKPFLSRGVKFFKTPKSIRTMYRTFWLFISFIQFLFNLQKLKRLLSTEVKWLTLCHPLLWKVNIFFFFEMCTEPLEWRQKWGWRFRVWSLSTQKEQKEQKRTKKSN